MIHFKDSRDRAKAEVWRTLPANGRNLNSDCEAGKAVKTSKAEEEAVEPQVGTLSWNMSRIE